MGIEEAILAEVEERGVEKGIEKGIEQGSLKTKIESIQMFLKNGKLTLEEIAEGFNVSLDFVQKIKSGEIK